MEILPDLTSLLVTVTEHTFNNVIEFDTPVYMFIQDGHSTDDIHTPYVFYFGDGGKFYRNNTWRPKKNGDKYVMSDDEVEKYGSSMLITNGQYDGTCVLELISDSKFKKPDNNVYPGDSNGNYKGYSIWQYVIEIHLDYDGVSVVYGAQLKTQNNNLSYEVHPLPPVLEKYKWWKDLSTSDQKNAAKDIQNRIVS